MKTHSQYIGASNAAQSLRSMLATIANSNATVMITGESGTGKELLARALHEQSLRAGSNFVPINCAAIPKDLLESELFGHRKGAFTGAVNDRVGRFELAHGGTIFLDEIGDMSLDMQVKLLRVLQERTIDPIGGSRQVAIDVRVIAATHRDLEEEISAGRFREDLYYRLNVLPVVTPPLRERPEDIPDLLRHFGQRFANPGVQAVRFDADFTEALQKYHWPGNVRELSNLVDRFSTLYAGQRLRRIEVGENAFDLAVLERPWPGGTTGDLLTRMLLHADFGGNAYVARIGNELVPMRPDWVDIVLAPREVDLGSESATIGYRRIGYAYWHDGQRFGSARPVVFLPDEVLKYLLFDARDRVHLVTDGEIVPDLSRKLPGRGLWVEANRAAVETAVNSTRASGATSLTPGVAARRCRRPPLRLYCTTRSRGPTSSSGLRGTRT